MTQLDEYVASLPHGPIVDDDDRLRALLTGSWTQLTVKDGPLLKNTELAHWKNPHWDPPFITFSVEHSKISGLGRIVTTRRNWAIDPGKAALHMIANELKAVQ